MIGTGFIGGIIGWALADAGHDVTFGSRHPEDREVVGSTTAAVASTTDALKAVDAVVLALPGAAVEEFVATNAPALEGQLVIDATNRMGQTVANCRAALPETVRYARAFNTLGGENMERPMFADGPADMFFSAPTADRAAVETIIRDVGLRPVFGGEDVEAIIDALFQLWIALAIEQGRGRRLAPPGYRLARISDLDATMKGQPPAPAGRSAPWHAGGPPPPPGG